MRCIYQVLSYASICRAARTVLCSVVLTMYIRDFYSSSMLQVAAIQKTTLVQKMHAFNEYSNEL